MIDKSDLRSLDFTVTRLLMKLFRTSNKDVIIECCYYFNFKLPRFDRFIRKLKIGNESCKQYDCFATILFFVSICLY